MSKININDHWSFMEIGKLEQEDVNLPHTVKIEPLNVYKPYMGAFEYAKTLVVEKPNADSTYFLEFEGVMTSCKVYVNGILKKEHFGGYLPFIVDITSEVLTDKPVELRVIVDNNDDKTVPPGKVTSGLDFLYYGGIYRNVNLLVKAKTYITSPVEDDKRGGGIRLLPIRRAKGKFDLEVTCDIVTREAIDTMALAVEILDGDKVLYSKSDELKFGAAHAISRLSLDNLDVTEWHVNNPKLYTARITLENGYSESVNFGFRVASVDKDGFRLNGELLRLFGVNRHQSFPYVGNAMSDEGQRREARLLKDGGNVCLRLAHYPQSQAFLDECDRLGMVVIDCVPGWQFLGKKLWLSRLRQNTLDMVRRDRNHASVMIYEISPNETLWWTRKGDKYFKNIIAEVKEELPSALTSGDCEGRRDAMFVGYDIPYSGKDHLSGRRPLYPNGERRFLRREYGDWGFGGNESSSRVTRGSGEFAMQRQTWNYHWTCNQMYNDENILGDLIWEGIDHNRGYFPEVPISTSGIFDIFRLPKLSYAFVRSQQAPENGGYVILPCATSYVGKKRLCVYSNCDRLALVEDGKVIADIPHDSGEYVPFDSKANPIINDNYWALNMDHIAISKLPCPLAKHTVNCMFDGGNCNKLINPPFTFKDIELAAKVEYRLVGYDKSGKEVAAITLQEPTPAIKLELELGAHGIDMVANGSDSVFLYVKAVNEKGVVDINFKEKVTLTLDNGLSLGGGEIESEAGIASFLIRANSGAKSLTITANSGNMSGELTIKF